MRIKVTFLVMATICLTAWVSMAGSSKGTGTALLKLPATVQTQCWDAAGTLRTCADTGEDGEHQIGAALPSPRFTINADSTVTDNLTSLIWAPDANLMVTRDPKFDNDLTVNNGRVTWQHALDYVALLNSESYLGHNDWRLPNINELESLRDRRYFNPCVSNTNGAAKCSNSNDPFTNVISDDYWSSTSYVANAALAWVVDMLNGYVFFGTKASNFFYVWPVKGGQ